MRPGLESILFFVFAYKNTEKSDLHKYVNENELSSNSHSIIWSSSELSNSDLAPKSHPSTKNFVESRIRNNLTCINQSFVSERYQKALSRLTKC